MNSNFESHSNTRHYGKQLRRMKAPFGLLMLWLPFQAHAAFSAESCDKPFELSNSGRYLVDACQNRFKLKSVNWYGASDTWQVPIGLHKQSIAYIADLILQMGFNSVRLPFSNQAIHDTNPVDPAHVAANPELIGKSPLQVYDAVVKGLTDAGIVVILNNHTTTSEWCCNYDKNGLWWGGNGSYWQDTQQWQADWVFLTNRYQNIRLVAGADLRNEVRTMKGNTEIDPRSPNWGGGGDDWRAAATNAGNAIVKANPKMLVILEGINWTGVPMFGGYRPLLGPVYDTPANLLDPAKLMYAAHNYGYIGPNATGAGGIVDGGNPTYRSMNKATLYDNLNRGFGFVATPGKAYSAPVWVSEFGIGFEANTPDSDKTWFANLTQYLIDNDLDFAYWALNGTKTDSVESYGLLNDDWSAPRDDWRTPYMNALLNAPSKTGRIAATERFTAIDYGNWDENLSVSLGDWDVGATKATCPDGYHMGGAARFDRSNGVGRYRIMCTNGDFGKLWSAGDPTMTLSTYEGSWYRGYDWAGGYTKYECPLGYFAAGVSKRWWGTAGLLCAKANRPLGNTCRTVWHDQYDIRGTQKGGDWATGAIKGQVGNKEYIAGIAHRSGNAAAILVCGGTDHLPSSPTMSTATSSVKQGTNISFDYAVPVNKRKDKNWIGIYNAGESGGSYITWQYAGAFSGNLSFSTSGLNPGNYSAYLYYDSGYSVMTGPVNFTVGSSGVSSNGSVCFYEHSDYQGASFCTSANNTDMPSGWNDRISSLKVAPGYQVELYEHSNYGGRKLTLGGNTSELNSQGFNDTASSFKVVN